MSVLIAGRPLRRIESRDAGRFGSQVDASEAAGHAEPGEEGAGAGRQPQAKAAQQVGLMILTL